MKHLYIPVNHSIDDDLNWVQVGEQMDDFHSVPDDTNGHQLLSVVAAVHHERVCEPLNDRTLGFPEPLCRVPSSSVWNVGRVLSSHNADVVDQRDVGHLNIFHLQIKYKVT